jgi:hypothetical protein
MQSQLIEEDMIAYLIASDISDVAELEEMDEQVYRAWLESRPEQQCYGYKWVQRWVHCMHGVHRWVRTRCLSCCSGNCCLGRPGGGECLEWPD